MATEIVHVQVFRGATSVADWQSPSFEGEYQEACARLAAKCLREGQLSHAEGENGPDPEQPLYNSLNYRHQGTTFHVSALSSKLLVVCITRQRSETKSQTENREELSEVDADENERIVVFDFQTALARMVRECGLNEKELAISLGRHIKVCLEQNSPQKSNGKSQSGDKKLDQIESNLETVAADVRENLGAIFRRGEAFDSLQTKSEGLREQSQQMYRRARRIRADTERGNTLWAACIAVVMVSLFLLAHSRL